MCGQKAQAPKPEDFSFLNRLVVRSGKECLELDMPILLMSARVGLRDCSSWWCSGWAEHEQLNHLSNRSPRACSDR